MTQTIEQSVKLFQEAIRLIPSGVNSPVRTFKSVGSDPLFMDKGQGALLTDEDGNTYIDYCMSWGPLVLGHADRDVVSALKETLEKGTSFGTPHRSEVELARLVTGAFPTIDRVRFVNSGTEATMSAIRLARGHTGRDLIVKFDGCYHGHADHLLVAAGSGGATFAQPDSAGVPKEAVAHTLVAPFNDLDAVKDIFKEHGDRIAAVITEPVPCNLGLIMPKEGFLAGLRELCLQNGSLLIFDEVITGFRLAPGGAQEYFSVKADLTALGKIIGGGLPVGAYGGRREIMENLSPVGPVYQAGTLSGNPLAMTAGAATLAKLADGTLHEELNRKMSVFINALSPALERHKGKVLFQSLESIFSVYFTDLEEITTVEQVKSCDMEAFGRFHRELLDRGVYLSPSGFEVGFISAAHSDEQLEETARAMSEALDIVLGE
jgi:glutamate-1-semialdehyde 2,1-aminomutase